MDNHDPHPSEHDNKPAEPFTPPGFPKPKFEPIKTEFKTSSDPRMMSPRITGNYMDWYNRIKNDMDHFKDTKGSAIERPLYGTHFINRRIMNPDSNPPPKSATIEEIERLMIKNPFVTITPKESLKSKRRTESDRLDAMALSFMKPDNLYQSKKYKDWLNGPWGVEAQLNNFFNYKGNKDMFESRTKLKEQLKAATIAMESICKDWQREKTEKLNLQSENNILKERVNTLERYSITAGEGSHKMVVENERLEGENKTIEMDNSFLRGEVTRYKEVELPRMRTACKNSEACRKEESEHARQLSVRLENATKQNARNMTTIDDTERVIRTRDKTIKKLEQEMSRQKFSGYCSACNKYHERYARCVAEWMVLCPTCKTSFPLDTLRAFLGDDKESSIATLEADNTQLKSDMKHLENQKVYLEGEKGRLIERKGHYKELIEARVEQVNARNVLVDALRNEKKVLKERIEVLEASRTALYKKNNDLDKRLLTQVEMTAGRDEVIEEYRNNISELNQIVDVQEEKIKMMDPKDIANKALEFIADRIIDPPITIKDPVIAHCGICNTTFTISRGGALPCGHLGLNVAPKFMGRDIEIRYSFCSDCGESHYHIDYAGSAELVRCTKCGSKISLFRDLGLDKK